MALKTVTKPGYTERFYLKLKGEKIIYSAEKTLSVVIEKLPPINSVVDVGCGVGTWLSSFAKLQDGGGGWTYSGSMGLGSILVCS